MKGKQITEPQRKVLALMQAWGYYSPQTDAADRTPQVLVRLGLAEQCDGFTYRITEAGKQVLSS